MWGQKLVFVSWVCPKNLERYALWDFLWNLRWVGTPLEYSF